MLATIKDYLPLIYWIIGIVVVILLLRRFMRKVEEPNEQKEKSEVRYNKFGIPENIEN